jgi:tRNA A-37 threonylcarbamoyl transferase component Bud32
MKKNPYVFRGPVHDPAMFFGRTHELNEMAAFLRGNQSISIVGPRKVGKTSLLFHLLRPETQAQLDLDEGYLFAYLDCEVLGEGGHEDILAQFAGEIAAALDERGLPAEPALERALDKPSRLSFEGAVRKLNQRSLRVVLILDEFERLSTNESLNVNFFNALRSAAARYQLAFVTASARPLIQLTYSGRSQEILSSPFFNIFALMLLGLLPEDEAHQVIHEPSEGCFSTETEDFIYKLVGGHPLGLQIACFHAFDAPDDPDLVERETMLELSPHFQYYWLNLTPDEQRTLRQLTDAITRAPDDTTLRGILRDLAQKCLICAKEDSYCYPSQAWERFVSGQPSPTPRFSSTTGSFAGTRLGTYEVLELLGRGGMAEVYKGRHPRLDRTVAIKILPSSLASDEDFRQRFEREAKAVAALRHPNIVQMFDFGDVEGLYYMVMEYIEGTDLSRYMNESGPMELAQVCPILSDLASALDYAHTQDLVHRDVKPSNVLLREEKDGLSAILTDFGIAKILGSETGATETGMMMGTLDYMAPEQIRVSRKVDGRADIYAAGVMAYRMLTGELPFKGEHPSTVMLGHLQDPPPDPRKLVPGLPESVAIAILRAMAKDPDERFETVAELAKTLGG